MVHFNDAVSVPLPLYPRRTVLKTGAAATGAAFVLSPVLGRDDAGAFGPGTRSPVNQVTPGATQEGTPVDPASYVPSTLTNDEFAILVAAVDRIFPADDFGPAGSEAGVGVFIDRALSGNDVAVLPLFQAGLKALDSAASPDQFVDLEATAQDAILTLAESLQLPDDPGGFFQILLEYSRQGMFSDPVHGGNIGFSGWDLINYPGVKLVWTAEDQAIGAVVEPEHISVAAYEG